MNPALSERIESEEASAGPELPVLEYLQQLWFRKRLILAVAAVFAVFGWVYANQLKSVYTATSSLLIGVPEMRVLNVDQVLNRDYGGDAADQELEILRSRLLAGQVVDRLNLVSHPEFNPALAPPPSGLSVFLRRLNPATWIPASWKRGVGEALRGEIAEPAPGPLSEEEQQRKMRSAAVSALIGKLNLKRIEWTNIITISVNSASPEMAARIANELPDAYIDDQLQAKFDATRTATEWLAEQLEEQKQKVEESERAVIIFRETRGLAPGAEATALAGQVSELNSQLIVARAERIDLESRLAQVRRLLRSEALVVDTTPDVMAVPAVQQLRRQQAEAQDRASELALEFGPKHPRMIQVNAELDDIRARIRTEVEAIATRLANELELARGQEQNLERSLREAQSQSGMQNREAIQLRALEREAAANRALFDTFLGRLKETSSTEGLEAPDSRVISRAEVPGGPSAPNRKRIFLLFVFGGLAAGCALALTLHALHPGLQTPEQVQQDLEVHAIGILPRLAQGQGVLKHLRENKSSAFIEALNSLRISMQLSDPDGELKVLQITSSIPEEGKSTLALSLAAILGQAGKSVLLVDMDMRRAGIERQLDETPDTPGLCDLVLAEADDFGPYLTRIEGTGVDFMRSGDPRQANAVDVFSSRRMAQIMARFRETYDWVILDTPPIMAVADARITGRLADKTLFVVRWNKTPRKVAKSALDMLHQARVPVIGAALQQVDLARYGRLGYGSSGYYYHYGRYGQYYQR